MYSLTPCIYTGVPARTKIIVVVVLIASTGCANFSCFSISHLNISLCCVVRSLFNNQNAILLNPLKVHHLFAYFCYEISRDLSCCTFYAIIWFYANKNMWTICALISSVHKIDIEYYSLKSCNIAIFSYSTWRDGWRWKESKNFKRIGHL